MGRVDAAGQATGGPGASLGTAQHRRFGSVLVIFMLLDYEDLRNRLLGLVGSAQLKTTMKALADAGQWICTHPKIYLTMSDQLPPVRQALDAERHELLQRIERWLDTPMLVLGFVWLGLMI